MRKTSAKAKASASDKGLERRLYRIGLTFKLLPRDYQEKIRLIADVNHLDLRSCYYHIVRRAVEAHERMIEFTDIPKPGEENDPVFLPAPYFDATSLWQALEPKTLTARRFAKFRRDYIKPQVEIMFQRHFLEFVSTEQVDRMIANALKSDRHQLPVIFPDPSQPTASRKYEFKHYRYVDALIQKGYRIEESLDLAFDHFFGINKGYSRDSFAKGWRIEYPKMLKNRSSHPKK